jgi:hypothetical protein
LRRQAIVVLVIYDNGNAARVDHRVGPDLARLIQQNSRQMKYSIDPDADRKTILPTQADRVLHGRRARVVYQPGLDRPGP